MSNKTDQIVHFADKATAERFAKDQRKIGAKAGRPQKTTDGWIVVISHKR